MNVSQSSDVDLLLSGRKDAAGKPPSFCKKRITSAPVAVFVSFLAMICGLILFLINIDNKHHNNDETFYHILSDNQTNLYWKSLHEMIVQAESDNSTTSAEDGIFSLLNPNSPNWKAIQWMVLEDPLATELAANLGITMDMEQSSQDTNTNSGDQRSKRLKTQEKVVQRYALAVVYYSAGGDEVWKNLPPSAGWLHHVSIRTKRKFGDATQRSPVDECEWLGVECNTGMTERSLSDHFGSIEGLNFSASSSFSLHGIRFPDALTLLTDLQILDVASKGLKGSLPNRFYTKLTNLRHLDLQSNQLTRVLNGDTSNFKTDSALSGEIRNELSYSSSELNIGALTSLEFLSVANNQLNEKFPPLSKLSSMRIAQFKLNKNLSGNFWQNAVPYWSRIEEIEISDTALSGTIPDLKENDSLRHLTVLGASRSETTGTLPKSLAAATGLKVLALSTLPLGMSGTLPTEYGAFEKLTSGLFDDMKGLEGTLPKEYGNWRAIEELNMYKNLGLTGSVPTEWGRMTNLISLKLTDTKIEGTIPSELGRCTQLRELFLGNTALSGSMPSEICSLRIDGDLSELETDCTGIGNSGAQVECMHECCTSCVSEP